jgi:SAM-dependent methyltransferase
MGENKDDAELAAIVMRYALRDPSREAQRYSWLKPDVHLAALESDRVMLRLFSQIGLRDLSQLSLLEIGCGGGGNLLRFLRWGFDPSRLIGNELLPVRLSEARRALPAETKLIGGDACGLDCGIFDIVYQSTVFSSILDDAFQAKLASHMWKMTKPGGGVLWYDFCYNNPKNPDVRGVPMRRIRELFPESRPIMRRITLAPPISRFVTRFSTRFYPMLNALPLLRTHALCWIPKQPRSGKGMSGE